KALVTKQLTTLKELGSFEVTQTEKYKQNIKVTVRDITNLNTDAIESLNDKPNEIDDKKENVEFSHREGSEERIIEKIDPSKNDIIEDNVDRVDCNKIITEKLTTINDINELFVLLNKYKNEGKLVYGNKDAFQSSVNCDILIIDPLDKTLEGYLIKKENNYYDLLSKTMVSDIQKNFKNMVAIWIMYFTK
ncbi:MAG: hypothetical protein C0412_13960, partial [Flavobacterium sp.]|nr:hypothetical protein [Flavobacterium sp.]